MKQFISISSFLFILVILLPNVTSDIGWKSKLGNDLKEKLETTQLINPEKVNVIIFTENKESVENFGKIKYDFRIIPAVAMEVQISEIESIAKLKTTRKILLDHPVKAFRVESIPLIKADDVSFIFDVNGTGINVSIVDTGIFNHTEFQSPNRIILQKCYISHGATRCSPLNTNESDNATDDNGHGTHVAGIAAGKGNGYGRGVAINASLFAVKVLNSTGEGQESDVINGIDWSVQNGAKIISLSLGAPYYSFTNCYDFSLSLAVDNATEQGVIIVVAAGNDGPYNQTIAAPGCAKTAVTVGSVNDSSAFTNTEDLASYFSSRGPTGDNRTKPDLVAPGIWINSTFSPLGVCDGLSNQEYCIVGGTSQATPFVSGVAALLLEKYNKTFGYFPEPSRVKAILLTAVNTTGMQKDGYKQRNNVYGAGRIDAYEALRIINYTINGTISQGEEKLYLINTTKTSLKVTLYWPENVSVNNNLDLIVGNYTYNFSYHTDPNDTAEQVFLYNLTNDIWKVFVKGINVSGKQKYFLASDSQFINDTIPPKWSNVKFNQTAERGEKINISVYWYEETSLSHAFLSTNETGNWKNYTDLAISLTGSSAWSNFSWINSSLANGSIVLWKIYANDTFGNMNVTQEFNFTVVDTRAPIYFNLTSSTDNLYAFNKSYQFNITLQDFSDISSLLFEWNGTNTTVQTYREISPITKEYYTSKIDLAAGNYTYRWFFNDTLNNWNFTQVQVYNITKSLPTLSILIPSANLTYSQTPVLINGSVVEGDTEANISLYRNGSLVNSSTSSFTFENITLPAGTWNYTLTYNETQNYTFAAVTNIINVYPAPTSILLWLNETQNNKTYDRGAIANITAQVNISEINVTIATNYTGVSIDIVNSTYTVVNFTNTSNLDLGVYNITAYYGGYNSNYSSSSRTYFLIVREAYRNFSINISNNILTLINASKVNMTFQILTNDTVTNENLNVTVGKDNPTGIYPQAITLNKYISVEPGISLTNNLTYVIINVFYLDSDIPKAVDENSLRLYYWNSTDWIRFDYPKGGVDASANYVWGNSTTFSNFTVAGLLTNGQSCTSNSNCSSNHCCHNICRPTCPYCGDGYCDSGETYLNCPQDCLASQALPIIVLSPFYVYDFLIILPLEIKIFTNESVKFDLKVKNIANGTLTNLKIAAKSEPYCCRIEISPQIIDLLKPADSTSFSINIPSAIKPSNYKLTFNVSSDQLWKEVSTQLIVKELPPTIDIIAILGRLKSLFSLIVEKEKEGYETKEALKAWNAAEAACNAGDYERCSSMLDYAEALLKEAVKKPVELFPLLLIIASGVGILVIIISKKQLRASSHRLT